MLSRLFFHSKADFTVPVLLAYLVATFFMACITYGIAVPSGLFVPCILMGSAVGRIVGELARSSFPTLDVHVGVYALIGAASMLSSVTRITITITVILFETSNQLYLIMPIMATVLMSKWIADQFNISLYDMHVELKCIPFVEPDPPQWMQGMLTNEVMVSPVAQLKEIETVHNIIQLLQKTTHNGFPVVTNSDGTYHGVILRNHVITLLLTRKFEDGNGNLLTSNDLIGKPPSQELLAPEILTPSQQSKNLPIKDVLPLLEDVGKDVALDMRSYVDTGAMTVKPQCPIARCFTLFRGMGIRHLPVVDKQHKVVGILTRKDLMTDFAQDLY